MVRSGKTYRFVRSKVQRKMPCGRIYYLDERFMEKVIFFHKKKCLDCENYIFVPDGNTFVISSTMQEIKGKKGNELLDKFK